MQKFPSKTSIYVLEPIEDIIMQTAIENCKKHLNEIKNIKCYDDLIRLSDEALDAVISFEKEHIDGLSEYTDGYTCGHQEDILQLMIHARNKKAFDDIFKCWVFVDETTGAFTWPRINAILDQ